MNMLIFTWHKTTFLFNGTRRRIFGVCVSKSCSDAQNFQLAVLTIKRNLTKSVFTDRRREK